MNIIDALRAPFPKEAIHWRAQTVTRDGSKALALAYLDARDVRQRLNEVVGPENWSCEHYDCGGGKLGCKLSLRINGEWITKTDGAGDTQVEAEKGAFSSALKRAAVSWGIGEYLYDMDAVWVPCKTYEKGGKKAFDSFTDDPWKFVQNAPVAKPPKQESKPMTTDEIADEINTGIAKCVNLNNLEAYWTAPQTQADLKRLMNEDMPNFTKLRTIMQQRKAQIADNHQTEHARNVA